MIKTKTTAGRVILQAFAPGVAQISDAWVVANGARVTSITAGTPFSVHVAFVANNTKTGIVDTWSVCLTVKDTTGVIQNYRNKDSTFSLPPSRIEDSNLTLDEMGGMVMPDVVTLTLNIKLWGSDQFHPVPDHPDPSLW